MTVPANAFAARAPSGVHDVAIAFLWEQSPVVDPVDDPAITEPVVSELSRVEWQARTSGFTR